MKNYDEMTLIHFLLTDTTQMSVDEHADFFVRILNASSENTWKKIYRKVFIALPLPIYNAVVNHSHVTKEVYSWWADDDDIVLRENVASNNHVPPQILRLLSEDGDINIRVALSENLATPVDTLVRLSSDDRVAVKNALLANPNFPVWAKMKEFNVEKGNSDYTHNVSRGFLSDYTAQYPITAKKVAYHAF